jgi:hypothetical protein
MGQHYIDPVQYILGKDNESPVEIEADAPQQHPDAAGSFRRIWIRYADGSQIILEGERNDAEIPFIEGPNGKVFKGFRSTIPNLKGVINALPDPPLPFSDFLISVRTRKKFVLNEENGHRSATLVNLAKIAWQLGKRIHFDPTTQRCLNDEAANRLIDMPMRAPWHF